uniref:SH2 domain-containing protein n=1 Tax=Acrobeloides nanus TaxID=290746 RepID=A0A914EQ57_9BILA
MSLLQEILDKMYVEPELLEQLDEEQKQTLFIKMREEQIRRWQLNEEKLERMERLNTPPKRDGRRVRWLTGRDGEVWIWVMGDHPNDKTIEQIWEEEAKQKAREIAENEVLDASLTSNDGLGNDSTLDEQILKNELRQMGINSEGPSQTANRSTLSLYEDADNAIESYDPKATAIVQPAFAYARPLNGRQNTENIQNHVNGVSKNVVERPLNGPPPIPARPAHLHRSKPLDNEFVQSTRSYIPGNVAPLNDQNSTTPTVRIIDRVEVTSLPAPSLTNGSTNQEPISHPIRKEAQNSILTNGNDHIRLRGDIRGRLASVDDEIEKRQSEIYERMIREKERLNQEASEETERQRLFWEEQNRKIKENEEQIRLIAQRAREQHRNLRTSTSLLPVLNSKTSIKEAMKNLPRPPKPKSRQAIIQWYKREELPNGTGLDPKTNLPARWFHGILSRAEAENLLADKPSGAFLVRVSERIWGYTVSYVVSDGQTKHFLIEKIPEGYQFLGTNQIVHKALYDLILYHETAPITAKGKEVLKMAVGQTTPGPPDYADLIDSSHNDDFLITSSRNFYRRF